MTWGDRAQRAGTGRQPAPMNRPPAQPLGIGVQPGTPNVIRARLVVIFGTGANTGLFVYSPTPAAGNLVASIAAAAGTDPYGNAYPAGIASFSGTSLMRLNAAALLGHITSVATISDAGVAINIDGTSLNLFSGTTLGGSDITHMQIFHAQQVGTDQLLAWDPVAKFPTLETVHTMTLDAGWTAGSGGNPAPGYYLNAQGEVVVFGFATHASYSGTVTLTNTTPLPAAYRPAHTQRFAAYTSTGACGMSLSSAGVLQVEAAPAASLDIRFYSPGIRLTA